MVVAMVVVVVVLLLLLLKLHDVNEVSMCKRVSVYVSE